MGAPAQPAQHRLPEAAAQASSTMFTTAAGVVAHLSHCRDLARHKSEGNE